MGKLTGGILGPVKGKVGAVVGSVVGGQNIVKSMPASYSDKNSLAQQAQRTAFKETLSWYKALAPAMLEAFPERSAKHSGYNVFMADNINEGVSDAGVDWNALNISKGSMINPEFTSSANLNDDEAEFAWPNDSDGVSKLATDRVVLVVIEPNTKAVLVSDGVYTRADGSALLTLPASMVGQTVQTYCYVKRADGQKAATSFRTGWFQAGSELSGSVQ